MKILVIADDKLIRWVLQEICAKEGHDVTSAANADGVIPEHEGGSYDVIFADLESEAVDAQAMAGKLLAHQPKASVILLSAGPCQEHRPLPSDAAIYGIIGKPFETSAVQMFLNGIEDRKREREPVGL